MDKSITVDSVKNSVILEPTKNRAIVTLVKVETLIYFVAPVQAVTERKEVG